MTRDAQRALPANLSKNDIRRLICADVLLDVEGDDV
jgi:hypothetical protein